MRVTESIVVNVIALVARMTQILGWALLLLFAIQSLGSYSDASNDDSLAGGELSRPSSFGAPGVVVRDELAGPYAGRAVVGDYIKNLDKLSRSILDYVDSLFTMIKTNLLVDNAALAEAEKIWSELPRSVSRFDVSGLDEACVTPLLRIKAGLEMCEKLAPTRLKAIYTGYGTLDKADRDLRIALEWQVVKLSLDIDSLNAASQWLNGSATQSTLPAPLCLSLLPF